METHSEGSNDPDTIEPHIVKKSGLDHRLERLDKQTKKAIIEIIRQRVLSSDASPAHSSG